MTTKRILVGGSFAPPITEEQLAAYASLAALCRDERCAGYMSQLVTMLHVFRQTPESQEEGKPHPTGLGVIVPLEDAEVKRIWDFVPWPEECDLIGAAFEKLTGETRNAAFHLLWYARELAQDREPCTNDRIAR